ncbi:MAG: HAMP domain-containing sensor histidine kinase [Candidatus Manganitrophaceae bacterium]
MEQSKNPLVADAFKKYLLETNVLRVRIACILGFTLVPLFSLLDYLTIPDYFRTFLFIRLTCFFVIFFLFLLSFTAIGKKNMNLLGAATAIMIGVTISLMVQYYGGYESPYYAGLNLVILGVSMLFAWGLKMMAAVCLTIYASYLIPVMLFDRIDHPEIFINNNAFLLATISIALTSAYFLSRLRYSEFESRYQLEESREALQVMNEKLTQLGEMRSRFFADISHELKTPLAVIRGEAEVTLRGNEKPFSEYKRALRDIILLVDQLGKLVSDLLFLARSESGILRIEKNKTSLSEIIEEAFREGEVLAMKKRVTLFRKEWPQGEIFVEGDSQRLKQLFLIVIDNAIKYSHEGGPVEISWARKGDREEIKVSDQGMGIPEESLPHVFERFYRADTTRAMAQGTGLGLPIAKWISEAHKGEIAISSSLGTGTTVTILLPKFEE